MFFCAMESAGMLCYIVIILYGSGVYTYMGQATPMGGDKETVTNNFTELISFIMFYVDL
jgi:hypothetical protein